MTQSEPDYSLYNLEQLYDIYRHIDKEQFPDRYAALQNEIVRQQRHENRDIIVRQYPPCWLIQFLGGPLSREEYEPSGALVLARIVAGLEFGIFALVLTLPVLLSITMVIVSAILSFFLYTLFFSGLAIIRKSLREIRDEHAVDLWSLVALAASPFSALLYTLVLGFGMEQMGFTSDYAGMALMLMPFVGFYTPYILAVFWVKYHCREDEF